MPNYTKVNWVNDKTLLNAENLNHMDEGIHGNSEEINKNSTDIKTVSDDLSNLKTNAPTVTIKQGNTQKGSFNLINQEEDVTIEIDAPPSASKTLPKPDGKASYGQGKSWSRADHVHPQNAFTKINVEDTSINSDVDATDLNLIGSDGISLITSARSITFKANKATLTLTEVNDTATSYNITKGHLEYNVNINGENYPVVVKSEGTIENINYNNPLKLDIGTYVVSNNIGPTSSVDYFEVGNYYCELDLTNPGIYNLSYTDIISNTFSENDWKTIAKAARTGEAQKRWKVGDYKNLTIPSRRCYIQPTLSPSMELFFIPVGGERPSANSLGKLTLINKQKFCDMLYNYCKESMTVTINAIKYIAPAIKTTNQVPTLGTRIDVSIRFFSSDTVDTFEATDGTQTSKIITNKDISIANIKAAFDEWGMRLDLTYDETNFIKGLKEGYGVRVYNPAAHIIYKFMGDNADDCYMKKTFPEQQYPCTILGFNHDDVYDTYSYGKTKAGMTLCMGVSRGNYKGSLPPTDWVNTLKPNLYESAIGDFDSGLGIYYLDSPYFSGSGQYWANAVDAELNHTQFYDALQNILKGSELDRDPDNGDTEIVKVLKMTAVGPYQPRQNYIPSVLSSDKISLLSENEVQGKMYYAAFQEGEQYEFFKRGNSKFFWDSLMLGDNPQLVSINLLSRSKVARDSVDGTDYTRTAMDSNPHSCCIRSKATLKYNIVDNNDNITTSNVLSINLDDFVYKCLVEYPIGTFRITITMNAQDTTKYDALIERKVSENAFTTIKNITNATAAGLQYNYGINVKNTGSTLFKISRDSKVSYEPNTTALYPNYKVGVLLPIFCL